MPQYRLPKPSPTQRCYPRSLLFFPPDTKRPHLRSHGHFMPSHVHPPRRHDCVLPSIPVIRAIHKPCSSWHFSNTLCGRLSAYTRLLAARCAFTLVKHPNVSCPSSTPYG